MGFLTACKASGSGLRVHFKCSVSGGRRLDLKVQVLTFKDPCMTTMG
ncbi:unnamed protein product [Rhodiola kirilowii]